MLSIDEIYNLQKSLPEFDSANAKLLMAETLGMMRQMLNSFGVPTEEPPPKRLTDIINPFK